MKLHILYTSDVHGQITGTNYAANQKESLGLTRLSSYLKTLDAPYLLLDNGDFLQGNVLLDYHRQFAPNEQNPIVTAFNHLKYDFINLGNHDFNYGFDFLKSVSNNLNAEIICANVVDHNLMPIYTPYKIVELGNIKIGLIGVVTQYIPNWEKPDHILDLQFLNAYDTVKALIPKVRAAVDYLIVLYHGGFEKDLSTGEAIGRDTKENLGYAIASLDGIDALLTGHQHVPTTHLFNDKTWILQTSANAKDAGRLTITFNSDSSFKHEAELFKLNHEEDTDLLDQLKLLEDKTQSWLDTPVGKTALNMEIKNQLDARKTKHPLFEWINRMQLELSGAQISAASLPNEAPGFKDVICLRDIAANFIYPNTLSLLEVTGKILREALEKTLTYFAIENDDIVVDKSFVYPKIEHYNYDIYDGITYTADLKKPKYNRLIELTFEGKTITDSDKFTLVINNYRASGGGDYYMFKEAKLLKEFDVSLFNLSVETIKKNATVDFIISNNFKLIK
ncbi:bifunctional metallophosphatase/5'-nucleotidase [Liberiplasma polymorphum]|uniref:bifunctional metallophosphatase/5'-nucleotidase n=1 Tax=Liberiplasma polymorphum TaxID=3374570 RepID=UPI0037729B6A